MNRYHWSEQNLTAGDTNDSVAALAEAFEIPPAGARFLVSRALIDVESARRYMNPSPDDSHDPFEFENMHAAVETVQAALRDKKSILIHGDYDVDGISGTAMLFHYFDGLFDNIYRFVPDRRKDGYGIATRAVEWAMAENVGLFIAVDCGTSDHELLSKLESKGMGVIVCDHHEFPPDGRYAGIMLNPSRKEETYPFRSLCGTGVAFKFIQALHHSGVRGKCKPEELVDLMAMATVGDVSPLIDENRYYVRAGLELMNKSPRPAVDAIKGFTRIGQRPITSRHISFAFAPRINAPGRVSRPKPSLEILCERRLDRARHLASKLESDNERRKELTRIVQDEASKRIRDLENHEQIGGYVVAGEGWDEGVLGIAAARMVEEFGRPAILMTIKDDVAKGSGRSIPGVNLKAHLDQFEDHFVRYGGHAQAVGLTMPTNKIESFQSGLSRRLQELISAPTGLPLVINGSLEIEECSMELIAFLSKCEPFGHGNKEPVWKISDVQVMGDTCLVGDGHMKLFFQDTRGTPGQAIAFGWNRPQTPDDLHGRVIDLAVTVKRGEYMGKVYPELRVIDVRFHGS